MGEGEVNNEADENRRRKNAVNDRRLSRMFEQIPDCSIDHLKLYNISKTTGSLAITSLIILGKPK